LLGGASIAFILSQVLRKRKVNQSQTLPDSEPSVVQTISTPTGTKTIWQTSPPVTFSPTPRRNQPTYEEYFNWIARQEGVRYRAKKDGVDKDGNPLFSIGYGHQIKKGEEYLLNATITEQKARELFKIDIEEIAKDVDSVVKVPINRNQKLALVSIRYNVGAGGFRGLRNRRIRERDLFLTPAP